jgi:hypothetical protein
MLTKMTDEEWAFTVSLFRAVRSHPCFGGRCQRGQSGHAFGRSRGGFSTKIHLKADFKGNPFDFHLTGGEDSDSRQVEILLDIGPDIQPRAAMTDKRYDAKANRQAARERGICPIISCRSISKISPRSSPRRSTKLGPGSNRPWESSSASRYAARKQPRTTPLSSRSPAASFSSNPSTRPRPDVRLR